MFGCFTPHLRVKSVLELGVDRLRSLGIAGLLLDVDCTLKRYGDEACSDEVTGWINQLRDADFRLCLVSNGYARRIGPFAERMDLPFVAKALKPLPFKIRAAVRQMGIGRSQAAMVGDQIFADVMAARLAGVYSVLVDPINPDEEPWFTRLKRRPERLLLRRMDNKANQRA